RVLYVAGLVCTVPEGNGWLRTTRTSRPAFVRFNSAFTIVESSRMYIVMWTEVVAASIAAAIWLGMVLSGVTYTVWLPDPPPEVVEPLLAADVDVDVDADVDAGPAPVLAVAAVTPPVPTVVTVLPVAPTPPAPVEAAVAPSSVA